MCEIDDDVHDCMINVRVDHEAQKGKEQGQYPFDSFRRFVADDFSRLHQHLLIIKLLRRMSISWKK